MDLIHDVQQSKTESRSPPLAGNTETTRSPYGQMTCVQNEVSKLDRRPMSKVDMRPAGGDSTAVHDDNNLIHS